MFEEIESAVSHLSDQANPPSGRAIATVLAGLMSARRPISEYSAKNARGSIKEQSCGIYGLFDGDELVYIGQSTSSAGRIRNHTATKSFTSAGVVPMQPEVLDVVERRLIRGLMPPLNRRGVKSGDAWGSAFLDDVAEVLNVEPGVLLAACQLHGVTKTHGVYNLKQVLIAYGREKK